MKNIIIFVLVFISTNCFAQEILTFREVFDFEVGDEFHYHSNISTPSGERLSVIEKHFSVNLDTVFYKFESNYYSSEYFNTPEPHLEYRFGSRTFEKIYTDLDSSIFSNYNYLSEYYPDKFTYDSINVVSTKWCDIILNGYRATVGDFEPSWYTFIYDKGIGLIEIFIQTGDSGGIIDEDTKLVYYKKSDKSCGTADLTSVFENQLNSAPAKIYPNPTSSSFNVELASENSFIMEVFTLQGKVLDHQNVQGNVYTYDLSKMDKGIYIIKVNLLTDVFYYKVLKN